MNEHALATILETTPRDEAAAPNLVSVAGGPLEFVGSSDDTIAEAVRRALLHASTSLRTLDGAGVVVIPQIGRQGSGPRFHVTLRVSPHAPSNAAAHR
jgi:flavin-binding protein dodecin